MTAPRLFVPGLSHHVYHRGNNRSDVFQDDGDCAVFLSLFDRAMRKGDVKVHGYALMRTHYHAVVTAPDEDALPRTMQRLGRGYTHYFNQRYQRTGTLWEGRYHASLISDERYWMTCLRYIEMNPVAAKIVGTPEIYRWSSYRHHAWGDADPLLTPHDLYQALARTESGRQAEWRAMCGRPMTEDESGLIRNALRRNVALYQPGYNDAGGSADEEGPRALEA